MKKIITTILSTLLIFSSPGMSQVMIDFGSQPTQQQLLQVILSATGNKDYSTALRVANNTVKLFPTLAVAYYYRAIALYNLGNSKDARLDFEQARKLYLSQLKSVRISPQEKNEAFFKLETIERHLKLLKS